MAVQKSRKTHSKKGMKRSHNRLKGVLLADDPSTGQSHLRHHVGADGYYRGNKVIEIKEKKADSPESEQ